MIFKELIKKVTDDILNLGTLQPVPRYAPKEIINYEYNYDSSYILNITEDETKYVYDKLEKYKNQFDDVLYKLKWNKSSRQAVIQFDQTGPLPNCTVSIQFQIRNNILFTTVFQRSQDIEKMQMDCEIFNSFSRIICENFNISEFKVKVLVGNMHKFIHNGK